MRFLVTVFLLLSWQVCLAQKYTFISYSTEEGLPQSQVSSIAQDSSGYLWIGTLGGLARFNGDEFVTYSTHDGLVNNRITNLSLIDHELWIGHDGGVSVFSGGKFRKYLFKGQDKSRNVSGIIKFKGTYFVCSNGGGLFKLGKNGLENVPLPNEDHLRIRQAIIFDGTLLLATRDGILRSTDGKQFDVDGRFERFSYSGITKIEKTLHLTTYTDGYYRYDVSNSSMKHVPYERFDRSLLGTYADSKGTIWFSTQKGIMTLDRYNKVQSLGAVNGLPVEMISCLFEDRDGTMWIGSQGKGFFRFAGKLFDYYDVQSGWVSDLFLCGYQKRNGDFYLGTYDLGAIKRNQSGDVTELGFDATTIWSCVQDVDGIDWFGAQNGLFGLSASGKRVLLREEDGLPGSKIAALFRLGKESMLIGGNNGVALYEKGKLKSFNTSEVDFLGTVRDFEKIGDSIYCVSNLGLFVLRKNKFQPLLKEQMVAYNIETDATQSIWFGTEEGLFRLIDGEIRRIQLLNDPGSNFINFLNYRKGKMYVGTNNGLYVLSDLGASDPKFERFGISEGIVDLETNLNSGFFDLSGDFWFGTAKGLIHFNTNQQKLKGSPPIIRFTGFLINYDRPDLNSFDGKKTPDGLPMELILAYNKNNLIFEFDAVSLNNRRGLQFQYYLEGLSNEWSPPTTVSTITFNSLPSGNYRLLVRAIDSDGNISNEFSMPLKIEEAFYRSWWFILIVVAVISLIVLLAFRARIRRIRNANEKERLQFKTRLLDLEQKSVNASMNRHFIFNALNSIQYFINTQDKLSANKYLTNFAQLIRKNLDSANSDDNVITLEEEIDRIRLYLSLEEMRFTGKFKYEIIIEDVDTESVKIPAMILQPFVENAIIHGILPSEKPDGLITIKVKSDGDYVLISVEDNGIGIRQSLQQKATVLGDHRSQGMEISAKRIEIIRSITKKNITLVGPEEITSNDGLIKGTYVLLKIPISFLEDSE
jgi:ligand-binding sensor domain-containing protein/signal transduction histidine kinase